jgi:hypothetical protein
MRRSNAGSIQCATSLESGSRVEAFMALRGRSRSRSEGSWIGFGKGWCSAEDGAGEPSNSAHRHGPQKKAVICSVFKMALTPKYQDRS